MLSFFGQGFIRWVETFYNNISSCVLNNVTCTSYFEVQRGVRQGDPLSRYLFIYVAIAIRSRTDINGLKIGQEEFKMVQYADDLTVFVPNIEHRVCKTYFSTILMIDSQLVI